MSKRDTRCHSLDPAHTISTEKQHSMTPLDALEMREFGKTVLSLALPVMLQSLLSAAVNYADVLMLSCINQAAMSAVSQANQITFLLNLFYLGLSTGVTILTSQYWGKQDIRVMEQTLGLAVKLSMLVSGIFALGAVLVPRQLMKLYTPDPELIGYGVPYLRIIGVGYLAMGLSQMLLASLKSIEQTKICSAISSASLVCNIVLNALSIFVLFPGDPARAVIGVAAATTIARVLELACSCLWMRRKGSVKLKKDDILRSEGWLKADFTKCTWQVQLNYIIWGGALSATTALIGYVSSDMVSAYAVANSVRNLAIVACTGVSTAGGILLGKYLGAGRLALAKAAGDKLRFWSVVLGALAGLLILAVRPQCLHTVDLSSGAAELLDGMLLISALYCIGKSFNSTMVGGIFCAGGDTKFGLICDTISMWAVILPAAWICAFGLKLEPIWIYLVLSLDEFVKMPFVAAHYKRYRWLTNLTRNTNEEEN